MNVLSIGNSFSSDAQRYLNKIASANGDKLNCYNLYIGGCSLATHFRNMQSGERKYMLEMNGLNTGFYVSLKEALLNRDWDVITFQQSSVYSAKYKSYQPYLEKLAFYVRELVPKAKLVIHQTWAYEQGSEKLNNVAGYKDYRDMLNDIKIAYEKAATDINADLIIPSGEVFDALLQSGIDKVHRDCFHASLGLGRYALGLTWYRFLTSKDICDNAFSNFEEEIIAEKIEIVKKCVTDIAQKYGI